LKTFNFCAMNIILFRGRPGTGKTCMSDLLSTTINLPVLRKDDFYDIISTIQPEHQIRNQVTFKLLYAILNTNRHNTSTIIIDFPFQFAEDIADLRKWCLENRVTLKSILVTCSDERLWASRFNKRAENPAPNQLITDFEKLVERYKEMHLKADVGELLIDTVQQPEENLAKMITFLV
jgi:tRNA uridine 5-carbamoylmethylation protein Kti12